MPSGSLEELALNVTESPGLTQDPLVVKLARGGWFPFGVHVSRAFAQSALS